MQPIHHLPTDVDRTPADVLRGAALYLQLHGWTQSVMYAANLPIVTPPACAIGAIGMVAFGERATTALVDRAEWRDYQRATNALADYLYTVDGTEEDFSVGAWNDTPGRSAGQVIAALNAAADEWEAQHTAPGGDRR
jgi:hypothetical protein